MTKIVIFGANGFIGRHLTIALAKNAENEVVAFDRFSGYQNGEPHEFKAYTSVKMVAGNFFNRDDVSLALEGSDYVFHLITATSPASSINDPLIDIDTNLRASIELFQLCVEHGVKKIIFPSSGGTVYGDVDKELIDENTVPQPRSPYGITKLTIEHYLRYFNFTHGLDYIVYRIANPYGPGQNIYGKQGVIPIFMHKTLIDEPLVIYGQGSMIRDYLYISDLIDMMAQTYDKAAKYKEYNLGSGNGESINDIVTAIEQCAGKTTQKHYVDVPPAFVEKIVLDTTRFREEFNIQPKVRLNDGIERTWKYVRKIG